ncbi:MAG: hypothetical protein COY72_01205 [Candidatus Nealsonbacteria bacterium CG_4_10_14_0_8_um_filter_35_10]|uniref:Uncharacterized protein n=2 Tax=Candidatus Nealsoniibacteriota TaxID=1817911 RepID=A0A2M7R7T3_9BACT|nr:MAG: hypothetical protein COY72_01205 [Candidatus Nealsonbacteria bacterium CG_4_10_14_0_8_um_filter_35_10]PJB99585.1 MAG: hypothetical protein CO077_00945 [Candidatus Nealsonbacteria bacterium CG_4_9_14_0_8_um_filter_35_12]
MGLFEKKEKISRKEFRDVFRKKNPLLPALGRRLIEMEERTKIEERLFGKKPMAVASKDQYKKFISQMQVEKYKAKYLSQKQLIDKKVRFLKKLGGI